MEIGDPDYVRLFLERAFACVYSPFVLLQLLKGAFRVGLQIFASSHCTDPITFLLIGLTDLWSCPSFSNICLVPRVCPPPVTRARSRSS